MSKISICIPTYKRSTCLAELLDSLLAQDLSGVEVVIADDASPDDTADVVERYSSRFPAFRYLRHPSNVGLDLNFLSVVEAAQGDYIWFMGDDDRMRAGALTAVKSSLERWPGVDGLTVGVIDYDSRLESVTGLRDMPPTALLRGAADVFTEIPHLLGFMSALVIDRRKWLEVCELDPIHDFKNLYLQVYIVGRVLQRHGTWGVLREWCIDFRSSNDQFLSKVGWFERMRIDIDAYEQIGEGLFANEPQTRAVMRDSIFESHILSRIKNAKSDPSTGGEVLSSLRFLMRRYHRTAAFWTSALPLLLTPPSLVRLLRTVYRANAPWSGQRRAQTVAGPHV